MKFVNKYDFSQFKIGLSHYNRGYWFLFFGILFIKFTPKKFEKHILEIRRKILSKIVGDKKFDEVIKEFDIPKKYFIQNKSEQTQDKWMKKLFMISTFEEKRIIKSSPKLPIEIIKREIIIRWFYREVYAITRRYPYLIKCREKFDRFFNKNQGNTKNYIDLDSGECSIDKPYSLQDVLNNKDDEKAKSMISENKRISEGFARRQNLSKDLIKFIIENGTNKARYYLLLNPMNQTNTCTIDFEDYYTIHQVINEYNVGENIYDKPHYFLDNRMYYDVKDFVLEFNNKLLDEDYKKILDKSISEIHTLFSWKQWCSLFALSRSPYTPINILNELYKSNENMIQANIVRSKKINELEIDNLKNNSDPKVIESLLQNPHLDSNHLDYFIKNPNNQIRTLIPQHPNVTTETLRILSEDNDEKILYQVARNKKTPKDCLKKLSTHKSESIRYVVAENPNIDLETMEIIFKDPEVREELIHNPNIPTHLIEKLKDTDDDYTIQTILLHNNTDQALIDKIFKSYCEEDELYSLLCSIKYHKLNHSDYFIELCLKHPDENIRSFAQEIIEDN